MKRTGIPKKCRVGLRDIASAAGVCMMTVSLSLRNDPKISRPTRERIQRLAKQLGYHPDPELSRLMEHLRSIRRAPGWVGLAIIDFYPTLDFPERDYNRCIRLGASRRADELGFGVTTIHGAEYHSRVGHILNVIRNRGIEGVLLLPSSAPLTLEEDAGWSDFSVVATSYSILSPRFHTVVPHQFSNMMRIIKALEIHAYHKIGAIFDGSFDERTAHNFTAALMWYHHGRRILVVPESLSVQAKYNLIAGWISEHQPDIVIAQTPETVLGAIACIEDVHLKSRLKVIGIGTSNRVLFSYIDERPELVGSAAVELLAGMTYYHETGIPAHPRVTMIDGMWNDF